jgi:hypothetical protein
MTGRDRYLFIRILEAYNADCPAGLHELTQRTVTGMGLDHGYLHMEFFVEGGEPRQGEMQLGEIGLRVAGCEITANHGYAYGFDVFGRHPGRSPGTATRTPLPAPTLCR